MVWPNVATDRAFQNALAEALIRAGHTELRLCVAGCKFWAWTLGSCWGSCRTTLLVGTLQFVTTCLGCMQHVIQKWACLVQIVCGRLRILGLAPGQSLGQLPDHPAHDPRLRAHLAPDVLQGTWKVDARQAAFLPRLRCHHISKRCFQLCCALC